MFQEQFDLFKVSVRTRILKTTNQWGATSPQTASNVGNGDSMPVENVIDIETACVFSFKSVLLLVHIFTPAHRKVPLREIRPQQVLSTEPAKLGASRAQGDHGLNWKQLKNGSQDVIYNVQKLARFFCFFESTFH